MGRDISRRYFQMGLWSVSHVTWIDALVPIITNSRILSLSLCVCVSVLASMRLTVKIVYADKIWLAKYTYGGNIVVCMLCTRSCVQCLSTCLHLLLTRATFSFLFSPPFLSCSLYLFLYDSWIDDEVHGNYSSARNRLQTWVHQTADVMCVCAVATSYKCVQNSSSLILMIIVVIISSRWFNWYRLMCLHWNNIYARQR